MVRTSLQVYLARFLLTSLYQTHEKTSKTPWDKETGRNVLRATMSFEIFCAICFEDKTTEMKTYRKISVHKKYLGKEG